MASARTESAPLGQKSHPSLWKDCHPPVRSDVLLKSMKRTKIFIWNFLRGWRFSHFLLVNWWRNLTPPPQQTHRSESIPHLKSQFAWLHLDPGEWSIGRQHHDSNWTLLWAAPENPRTAPSPGLPGIRVLHRSSICISSSDFPCDGFSRSKPAGASRLCCTRASISKAIRAERKPVEFFFWIMLPNL